MTRRSAGLIAAGIVAAIGLVGVVAGGGSAIGRATSQAGVADRVTWSETEWPFLRDQWGKGQAWRCEGAGCGDDARLYLRSKVGFCDCFNHVDDDDDVDRLTDFDFIGSDRVIPLGAGRKLAVANNPARLRTFRLEGKERSVHAMAVVVAVDCEARVAMLVSSRESTPTLQAAAIARFGDRGLPRAVSNRSDAVQ